ncbi:HPF/RaiA family ribosome-associated protein [Rhodoblastus sp. 17X3]|uniref:HPF/RaiA family ribosome-associated protein n=1 Tax=Rhodoblastus sp. 17X3 TaxID=3047026 RepID=UPI0024B86BDB|nr:HPF/RaiA family ribosome-associated protein [Rhodoblastus sp. 17X3]MDI9847444.1 HPF/RaiA family ribosome-associated protein [Rhodoblastus sp. 17X3]
MQTPTEIAFQHCEPSEAIRAEIAKQTQRLEKFSSRITSCHVAVTKSSVGHRHGDLFRIDVRIAMPGHNDVIVDRSHGDAPEHEHAAVAIRDAFDAAIRQVEDVVRELRDEVKQHAEPEHGRVARFLAGEDCGFIETPDGREIFFHRNAVLDGDFDRLTVGSDVRFVEEAGEKGAQASTVRMIGKHHFD